MVHVIKVYFTDCHGETEIRRLAISSDLVSKYELLKKKAHDLFPVLENRTLELRWKDSENDMIHMSSDEELAQALANGEDGLLKIYMSDLQEHKNDQKNTLNQEEHKNVICDGCDKIVHGNRYKCLQCHDYDLCSSCNLANKHPDHDFIKLVKPVQVPREWVYLGSRKLWKSMFRPHLFRWPHGCKEQCKDQKPSTSTDQCPNEKENEKPNSLPKDIFTACMKGNFEEAAKILDTTLGHDCGTQARNLFSTLSNGNQTLIEQLNRFLNGDIEVEIGPCPYTQENLSSKDKTADKEMQSSAGAATTENPVMEEAPLKEKAVHNMSASSSQSSTVKSNLQSEIQKNIAELEKNVVINGEQTASPVAETCDEETLQTWTLLNGEEDTKDNLDDNVAAQSSAATSNIASQTNCSSSSTMPKVLDMPVYPDLRNARPATQQPNVQENCSEQSSSPITTDPYILEGLQAMQSMGFTNEGGWLERLLIAKKGNINEVLEALYPR